jgi:hypothetical protein
MNLTDEQAEILATCAYCQSPLDSKRVKSALEAGEVEPVGIVCPDCGLDEETQARGLQRMWATVAAYLLVTRIERAGLAAHYGKLRRDAQLADALRSQNRQN